MDVKTKPFDILKAKKASKKNSKESSNDEPKRKKFKAEKGLTAGDKVPEKDETIGKLENERYASTKTKRRVNF